jgi:hypothetical protein
MGELKAIEKVLGTRVEIAGGSPWETHEPAAKPRGKRPPRRRAGGGQQGGQQRSRAA